MAESAHGARALAWDILCRVDETDAFADILLGHRLPESGLDRRDQGLVTQLVYGTLAWRGYLDRAIASFAGRSAEALDPGVRVLLEMSIFQLLRLERVPAYAAVNSGVELSKTHKGGRASGLVNAVLRRAAREGVAGVALPAPENRAAYLAARWSHPQWLVERWLEEIGDTETAALLAADNDAAPTVLRVNRMRAGREAMLETLLARGQRVETSATAPDALRFEGGSAAALPEYAAGALSLQSEASQLVSLLLDPRPDDVILDACAGSGGKTTHLAELQGDRGRVLALDLHRHALARLATECKRLGLRSIDALRGDATRLPLADDVCFDRILLDAPCSGLGTLRQHPEIRWRRSRADIAASGRLQEALLRVLLDRLRPGGVLVYAVCTTVRAENEDVIAAVLGDRDDVEREDARLYLPREAQALVDDRGALRTAPHRGGLDGFFAVRLLRR